MVDYEEIAHEIDHYLKNASLEETIDSVNHNTTKTKKYKILTKTLHQEKIERKRKKQIVHNLCTISKKNVDDNILYKVTNTAMFLLISSSKQTRLRVIINWQVKNMHS